jgi:D-aminopeptidase
VQTYYKGFDILQSSYEEFANGTIYLKEVAINFAEVGEFMLVAVVNGVESVPTGKLTIVPPDPSIEEQIQEAFEIIVILSVVFAALIS